MCSLFCVILALMISCCSLPCPPTATVMTFDGVLDENEEIVQDLGDSTSVNFAWDIQIYTANQGPETEPDLFLGGGGGGC